ncbi:MAG TPA: zinc ribbon domain-containing protein [Methylomirabilota bacterium]
MTDAQARRDQAAVPVESAAPPSRSQAGTFFLVVAFLVAIAAVVVLRGTEAPTLVFIALTILAAGLAGVALHRTLVPLTGALPDETPMVAGRTRAALERDKMLTLRAIKELEFDRAMGKVSEGDFAEMRDRLRSRALRLMRQLEGEGLYRPLIEREVAARLADTAGSAEGPAAPAALPAGTCLECGTVNDADARFCKQCGQRMSGAAS